MSFLQYERIYHHNQHPQLESNHLKPAFLCTSQYLHLNQSFFLNTHLQTTIFHPSRNGTRSHVSLFFKDFISSSIEIFQDFASFIPSASSIDLGSSMLVFKEKIYLQSSSKYLSGGFICLVDF
jgi:hypothetical protein